MNAVVCLLVLVGILQLNVSPSVAADATSETVHLKVTSIKGDITQVEVTDGRRYLISVSSASDGSTMCYAVTRNTQQTEQEDGDVSKDDVISTIIAELEADPDTFSESVDTAIMDEMFRLCDTLPEEVALILSQLTNTTAPPVHPGVGHRKRTTAKRALGWFIYPGTKWCGAGNIAENATDIGTLVETDTCCRIHDQCDVIIDAWTSKYGMFNWALWRVSSCDCDDAFKKCLKNVTSEEERPVAKTIRRVFFKLLGIDCFVLDSNGEAVMRS